VGRSVITTKGKMWKATTIGTRRRKARLTVRNGKSDPPLKKSSRNQGLRGVRGGGSKDHSLEKIWKAPLGPPSDGKFWITKDPKKKGIQKGGFLFAPG